MSSSNPEKRVREAARKAASARASDPLKEVHHARLSLNAAEQLFTNSILRAHGDGSSLRAIADAAGVSHEQVRRIIKGGER